MDTNFIPRFLLVLRDTLTRVPLIMIFSLILAILLNQNIKYRGFFRVVMFLPFLFYLLPPSLLNLNITAKNNN